MDYLEFERRLNSEQSQLKLPEDSRVLAGPGCINPTQLLWTFVWSVHFTSDNKYMRVWELYDKISKLIAMSRRTQFVFHYGPIMQFDGKGAPIVDELGSPKYTRLDPVDIRIDTSCRGGRAHLHYGAPEPHYRQEQVEGLQLDSLDAFAFARGILRHRECAQPLNKIFGFRVL